MNGNFLGSWGQRLFSGFTPTFVPTFTLMSPGFAKATGYGEFNGTSIGRLAYPTASSHSTR